MSLKSVFSKRYKVPNQHNPVAENILNRDFSSATLGQKWVSDITHIKVANQWNYATTIIDLADRKSA